MERLRKESESTWPFLKWSVQAAANDSILSFTLCGFVPESRAEIDELTVSIEMQTRVNDIEISTDVCVGPRVFWAEEPVFPSSVEVVKSYATRSLATAASQLPRAIAELVRCQAHP